MDGMGHIPRVWFSLTKSKVRDAIQERFQVNDVSEFLKELAGRHPFETKHKSWNRLSIFRPRSAPNSFWELGRLDPCSYFFEKKRLPGKLRQDVVEWDDESFCSGQRAKSTKSFNKIQRVLLFFCCFWTLNLCFSNDFRRNFYLAGSSQVGPWLHLFVQGWWGWEWAKGLGKKCYVFFDISGVISWCLGFFTRKIGEMIQFDEHGFSKMGASTTKYLLFFWGGGVRVENGLRLIFWST